MNSMVTIRRVKRGKILYVEQRGDDGRVQSLVRWSRKFLIKDAVKEFNKTGDINPAKRSVKLSKVREVVSSRTFKPRTGLYQYFVRMRANSKTITARSRRFETSVPKRKARAEAIDNGLHLLAEELGFTYDADELNERGIEVDIIDEGFVTYRAI